MRISKIDPDERRQPLRWLAADIALVFLSQTQYRKLPDLLRPPYGTVLLDAPNGPLRLAAFQHANQRALPRATSPVPAFSLFDEGSQEDSLVDVTQLQTVQSRQELLAMAEQLDIPARRRLLDFLLGFCRTAFRLSDDREFATLCAQVATLCCRPSGVATPIAHVPSGRVLLRGTQCAISDTLYLIGPSGTRLVKSASALTRRATDALTEDVLVIPAPNESDWLLAAGAELRIWQIAQVSELPHVMSLTGTVLAAARGACLRALSPATPGSVEAALLRELHLLAPASARRHDDPTLPLGGALELALPDGNGGVFLSGWLRDPLDLVVGVELHTPLGSETVAPDALHRVSRPDLRAMLAKATHPGTATSRTGFVARLPDPSHGAALQPTLRLLLGSGAAIELTPPLRPLPPDRARDAVLSSVLPQEVLPAIMTNCLMPAASGLHRLAAAERGDERVIRFGGPIVRPTVSILIPLYRVLGFLRFQLAAFAEDPACRAAEIIYVLDSPEQADEVEHLLRGLQQLHDIPLTLVVMERNGGFAAATNAAARHASGRELLLLNSDVIPMRPGWLTALQAARHRAGAVAATPKLLFDDGSLQHAGLYFALDQAGGWFNNHYHKGLPRAWPGADTPRRVPGGTGAALLIDRSSFERCGGVCEDYVVGDYEDSDLCLRLQQDGGVIVYEPGAELYHFERRSIAFHPGYTRTLACQYNRQLHHQRWAGTIAALMASPEFSRGMGRGAP
jgi:GT2 family glycosyltransferase